MNICIVAHLAYGAITGGETGHAGGVEHQTSLLARWLAKRGHFVSFLTWDEGQDDEEYIDGVFVIKMCRQNEGLQGLRFFHPRWTNLIRAMAKADAEIYYHNCAEYVTGQIALWCGLHGRTFIYSVASDAECEPIAPPTKKLRDRFFFRYGLHKANQIIVQTRKQRQMLLDNFGIESIILPMPCLDPPDKEDHKPQVSGREQERVLWVGRIDEEKRLEFLLEVAESMSNVSFDIVGKPSNPKNPYSRDLLIKARTLSNVSLHGLVPRNQMPDFYNKASMLCCTSLYEGFPNTFLEAWSYGLPIVSTYDPDELITSKNLGVVARDKFELISGIKTLLNTPHLKQAMSGNARKYYRENHALDRSMIRFEEVFQKAENIKRLRERI